MKYIEIFKVHIKTAFVRPFDLFMGMAYPFMKIFCYFILWQVIYSNDSDIKGLSFAAMMSYYIIHSCLSGINRGENVSLKICNHVIDGTFSKFMVLPVNIQNYFLCQSIGESASATVFSLAGLVLFSLGFKINLFAGAQISIVLLGGLILITGLIFMIGLHFFIGILAFKFLSISFLRMSVNNLMEFITGGMVPLMLLPDEILAMVKWTPFYYVLYLPSMLFIGRNQEEALPGFIIILLWTIFIFLAGNRLYDTMRKDFEGVGI